MNLSTALAVAEVGPPPAFVSICTYDADGRAVGVIRGDPSEVITLLEFRLGFRDLTWRVLPDSYAAVTDVGDAGQHVPALADLPAPAAAPR